MALLKDISVLIAIWVAIYGIDSWRREHIGKRRIELAEEVLALFYEAADAIRWMRHPAGLASELDEVTQWTGERDEDYEARKQASVVFVRYNKRQEIFSKIHSLRYRFMAQVGTEHTRAFDLLHQITSEIFLAARIKAALLPRAHFRTEEALESHHLKLLEYEAVLYDSFNQEDPINPKLKRAVEEIEACCKGIIDGQGSLYKVLNWPLRLR